MKRKAVLLIVSGLFLEFFGLFGNRGPFPVILMAFSPEYLAGQQGYQHFLDTGFLTEGDVGFNKLRQVYMSLHSIAPEPLFPMEEMEGLTVTQFQSGLPDRSSRIREQGPVFVSFSNGEVEMIDHGFVHRVTSDRRSRFASSVNAGLLVAGCLLLYYGLRIQFLVDARPRENRH